MLTTLPPISGSEIKERVELYLYSHSVPLWQVIGWNSPCKLCLTMTITQRETCRMTSHCDLSSNNVERWWWSAINTVSVFLRRAVPINSSAQRRMAIYVNLCIGRLQKWRCQEVRRGGHTLRQNPLRSRSRWRKWKTLWEELWEEERNNRIRRCINENVKTWPDQRKGFGGWEWGEESRMKCK